MVSMHRFLLSSASVLAAVITAGGATAQTAESGGSDSGIQDIVVTAQKRSQSLNDVGLTINVATADTLAKQGVTSVTDLAKVVPGFNVSTNGDGNPIYTLRGISFNARYFMASPTVAVNMDEAPIPYSFMTQGSAFDLERVEVLKGPQGTLYGLNSTGGAINLIAAKPTDTLSYGGEVSYGRFDTLHAQGFVSGPLSSTLKARLAVDVTNSGPWQYSKTRPDDGTGDQRKFAGRLLLDWQASDRLRITTNLNGWVDNGDTQQPQVVVYKPNFDNLVIPPIKPLPDGTNPNVTTDNARSADWDPNFPTGKHNTYYQGVVRADYDVSDNMTFTSITNYAQVDIDAFFGNSGYPYPFQNWNNTGYIKSFNQEIRLAGDIPDSGIHYIIGANYYHDSSLEENFWDDTFSSALVNLGIDLFTVRSRQKGHGKAIFASVDWDVSDQLTLSGGIRYSEDYHQAQTCLYDSGNGKGAASIGGFISFLRAGEGLGPITIQPGGCLTIGPVEDGFLPFDRTQSFKEHNVPWRINANYKFSPDASVYATVSRGFKSGAFPAIASFVWSSLVPVKQEQLTAYEAGFRARLFNRTFSINAAGFYYDYKDKQLTTSFIDPYCCLVYTSRNIPKSHVTGFDMDITWQPVKALTLRSALTYVDSVSGAYPDYTVQNELINVKGHQFNDAPRWSSVSDAEVRLPISSGAEAFAGATVTYRSSSYSDLASSPEVKIDAYTLLDLRAGVSFDSGVDIMAWGKNVTNKYYWNLGYVSSESVIRFSNMPVTYGLTIRYKY